jgi:hypothetical protein
MVHPVGFRGYGFQAFQAAEGSGGAVSEGAGGAGLASIAISPRGDLRFWVRAEGNPNSGRGMVNRSCSW